jgi:hypothetical protein
MVPDTSLSALHDLIEGAVESRWNLIMSPPRRLNHLPGTGSTCSKLADKKPEKFS